MITSVECEPPAATVAQGWEVIWFISGPAASSATERLAANLGVSTRYGNRADP
jgi:hypothetical protein